jgi:DNA repair protein RecO (recombination protein O)
MALKRISDEPALVLHRYDWSESSLILEVFTRHHGRQALVAKGAKRPSSNFRPVLLPLQPLYLTYSLSPDENAEIHTLKSAEWVGGHIMPMGDALLSGYYLNELLMRLLARNDPHPHLFDAYRAVVRVLAGEHGEALQPVLRAFEIVLLRDLGLLPSLDVQTSTLQPLSSVNRYVLAAEGGLREAGPQDRGGLEGKWWLQLQAALDEVMVLPAVLKVVAQTSGELKAQLRALLHYHCGSRTLRTRQLMMDLQNL